MTPQDFSHLDIPAFLRVDAAEAERRRKWNAEHPPVAMPTFSPPVPQETVEARAKFAEEKKQKKNASLNALNARKKAEAEREKRGIYSRPRPGLVWSPRHGGFVKHNTMTRANYERCLREMPDEAHRAMFIKTYGPGVDTPAPAAAPIKARKRLPVEDREVVVAGKHESPIDDKTPAKHLARDGAKVGAKVAKPKTGKAEQVAAVAAMLERPEGATLEEIGAAMGWLKHSASAFLSVNFRNQGRATPKTNEPPRGTVYRLEKEAK